MIKRLRILGLSLVVALCSLSSAADDAVTLRFAPKAGDTFMYKLVAKMQFKTAAITITTDLLNRVTQADKDGYAVESKQSNLQITVGGSTSKAPGGTDTTSYKSNGEVVDVKADGLNAEYWRRSEITNFVYPSVPVKVGDQWVSSVKPDEKKGLVATSATYKVEGIEDLAGRHTAKIKVSFSETEGAVPAKSESLVWIDIADGSMVKTEATWTNVPSSGTTVNGTITIERFADH